MKTTDLRNAILVMFLALLSVVFAVLFFQQKALKEEANTLNEASSIELKTWRNINGESMAKIQVLESVNHKTFLAFKTQDSTIKELQLLVKENKKLFKDSKGSATIIRTETIVQAAGKTIVVKDTLNYPIYKSTIENKWYTIKTEASKDSTKVDFKTFHTLSLAMGSERQGLFKKDKTFATVKDSNPYSDIKDLKVYSVSQKKKHFVIGPYLGAGINNKLDVGGQVGIGIMYKLIEF